MRAYSFDLESCHVRAPLGPFLLKKSPGEIRYVKAFHGADWFPLVIKARRNFCYSNFSLSLFLEKVLDIRTYPSLSLNWRITRQIIARHGMLRGQINMYLLPGHPIIAIRNNRNQNVRRIGKKFYCHFLSSEVLSFILDTESLIGIMGNERFFLKPNPNVWTRRTRTWKRVINSLKCETRFS